MPVMKENFSRNAHDTTFSPTGLYNFVKDNELVDSSGNGKNLTEYEAPTDDSDFLYGTAEGLSHFTYYRNSISDFSYTGAMSYCCLLYTTQFIPDSTNDHAQLGVCDDAGAGTDARWALQINNTGYIRYIHQTNGTLYTAIVDRKVREHYKWNHVAFTRDSNGTAIKIYFNGQQIHSETLGAAPGTQGNAYFSVGDIRNYADTLNNSVIESSCAIYDQELDASQIKYLARKTLGYHKV
jgi:hypothetical protein